MIDAYLELFRTTIFMPVLGNHDKQVRPRGDSPRQEPVCDVNARAFRGFFELPDQEWMWHFDVPAFDARFIALDLNHIADMGATWQACHPFDVCSEQFEWYDHLTQRTDRRFVARLYNEQNSNIRSKEKGKWHQMFHRGTLCITGSGSFAERAVFEGHPYLNTSVNDRGDRYAHPNSALLASRDNYVLLTFRRQSNEMIVDLKGLDGSVLDRTRYSGSRPHVQPWDLSSGWLHRLSEQATMATKATHRRSTMAGRVTRRAFLRSTALGGIGLVLLRDGRSARTYAANDRVNLAIVGVSGRGGWFSETMPKLANVVAMCDVNDRRAAPYYKAIPQARTFHDFRRMLDEMGRRIDAVTVATPDHTHAVITAAAIRRGKHVLCEKPLTHDVFEARTLRALAREYKVATQMGNQGTASEAFRRGVELIQAGALGSIREVHAWNTGGGAGERPIPTEEHPVPDFLQWDLWLGPAKFRPYNSRWAEWHSWRDFATGELGNWGCHTMNILFKGLRIDSLWNESSGRTIRLDVEVSGVHEATFPKWEIVRYAIPARGEMPPVTVNWYNGGGRAPGPREKIEEMIGHKLDWGDAGEKKWADHAGCVLVGDRGVIHSTGHNASMTVLPEDRFEDAEKPAMSLPRSRGHEVEWLDACRGGAVAVSNFDYSGPLTEFVLLGNVATLFGKSIEYDPVAMKVTNFAEANEALKREYRAGWSL